jgi:hypothetical protein
MPEDEPLLDYIVSRNCALSKIELRCPEVPVTIHDDGLLNALLGVPSTGVALRQAAAELAYHPR